VTAAQKAEAAAIKAEEERVKREQEEEAARIEAEKKKKKAMKYPAEGESPVERMLATLSPTRPIPRRLVDYLVEYSAKESSAGKPQVRPSFNTDLPFPMHFETVITTWNFLNAMS